MKRILLSVLSLSLICSLQAQTLVKDILTGVSPSTPIEITPIGDEVYFLANDGTNGKELWKSDGTESGTTLIKNINPNGDGFGGIVPGAMTEFNGDVYFAADDGTNGTELWKTDGTTNGTVMVKNIGSGSNNSYPQFFVQLSDKLLFRATSNGTDTELWKTDGTDSGTVLLKNINPNFSFPSNPAYLTRMNSEVFFTANDGTHGYELWKTDGTDSGTVLVKDIGIGGNGFPRNLTVMGNEIFFTASTQFEGKEVWKSDGTESGTVMVKDINPGNGNSDPNNLTVVGDFLFFTARDNNNNTNLWKTDGTEAGTVLLKTGVNLYKNFTSFNGMLYFSVFGGTNGSELWRSDGTESGTVLLKDIYVGSNSGIEFSGSNHFTVHGSTLFFRATDGVNGRELWQTDGTITGTVMVDDIYPGGESYPTLMTSAGNKLFFVAKDGTHGEELWAMETFTTATLTQTACDSLILHGTTFTTSGTHEVIISNTAGYDSIITLNLTVVALEANIIQAGLSLKTGVADTYQWYLNGIAITGATGQSYIPDVNGDYEVELTSGSCTKTSETFTLTNVGVHELSDNAFKLYPNPSIHALFIESAVEGTITLYGVNGAVIQSASRLQQGKNTINVSGLQQGVYILQVQSNEGIKHLRFVKK